MVDGHPSEAGIRVPAVFDQLGGTEVLIQEEKEITKTKTLNQMMCTCWKEADIVSASDS